MFQKDDGQNARDCMTRNRRAKHFDLGVHHQSDQVGTSFFRNCLTAPTGGNDFILCVGSATLDQFLTIEQPLSKIKLGDKVLVKSLETHSGGGATNSAAALSKLGLKVKVLTKLGADHAAEFILKELKEYRIKNLCRHHSHKQTDQAVILHSLAEKDRIILVHKGASEDLGWEDFSKLFLRVKWIYLASLLGKSFQTAKEIAAYAQKRKINILFNPSLYLAQKGKKGLKLILEVSTLLVLNLEEAQALLNTKSINPKELLRNLSNCGPQTVVITNAEKKIYALDQSQFYSVFPPRVKIVHTAGAGDAFTSGLLAGMIKEYSFEDALRMGLVNAAAVIQGLGTKNHLLTEKEALAQIKKYKIKVIKTN